MDQNKESRGTVTVGAGTNTPRQVEIQDFLQAEYANHRLISVCGLEGENGLVLSVENPASTGRSTSNTMWLSQESFLGLLATMHLYLSAKGFDLHGHIKASAGKEQIDYTYSNNLNPATFGDLPNTHHDQGAADHGHAS